MCKFKTATNIMRRTLANVMLEANSSLCLRIYRLSFPAHMIVQAVLFDLLLYLLLSYIGETKLKWYLLENYQIGSR